MRCPAAPQTPCCLQTALVEDVNPWEAARRFSQNKMERYPVPPPLPGGTQPLNAG